ncbi:MAG: uracil-DNA glycosylase [Cocleimonas sp.]
MTSPSQLKYLDAMGIPVWVSRDLVVVEKVDEKPSEQTTRIKKSSSGAQSILQNLEQAPKQQKPIPVAKQQSSTLDSTNSLTNDSVPADLVVPSQQNQKNKITQTTSHIVYGIGDLDADWMVIGESPEFMTNHAYQPFAGEAGILLTNMIRAVGVEVPHKQAYLINVLKISQGESQTDQETVDLNKVLNEKIAQVKPKIVLLVGQLAAQNLLQTKEPLARLRGKTQKLPETDIPTVVTYYPTYLLNKPQDKRKAWQDLKLAMRLIADADE